MTSVEETASGLSVAEAARRHERDGANLLLVRASARCAWWFSGTSNDSSHSLTDRVLEEAACEVVVVRSSSEALTTTGVRVAP